MKRQKRQQDEAGDSLRGVGPVFAVAVAIDVDTPAEGDEGAVNRMKKQRQVDRAPFEGDEKR